MAKCNHLYSSSWHSETDRNIALLIFRDLSAVISGYIV